MRRRAWQNDRSLNSMLDCGGQWQIEQHAHNDEYVFFVVDYFWSCDRGAHTYDDIVD